MDMLMDIRQDRVKEVLLSSNIKYSMMNISVYQHINDKIENFIL